MISARPVTAEIGSPPPSDLAIVIRSGSSAVVLAREQPAGAAEPGLHLVDDEQDAVLAAESREELHAFRGATTKPPSPSTSSMTTQATFSAATCVLKNSSSAAVGAGRRRRRGRGTRRDRAAGRPPARTVRSRTCTGRTLLVMLHRQERAPVEGVVEDDDGLSPGRVAGDLDGVLERLGAAVGEHRLLRRSSPA